MMENHPFNTMSKSRTTADSNAQKRRTYNNMIEKYAALLEKHPNSSHAPTWKRNIEFYSKKDNV